MSHLHHHRTLLEKKNPQPGGRRRAVWLWAPLPTINQQWLRIVNCHLSHESTNGLVLRPEIAADEYSSNQCAIAQLQFGSISIEPLQQPDFSIDFNIRDAPHILFPDHLVFRDGGGSLISVHKCCAIGESSGRYLYSYDANHDSTDMSFTKEFLSRDHTLRHL